MQEERGLRSRMGGGAPWLRIGLASVTIIAPLITRWNDLRAAERARALAEEAEARLRNMRSWAPWSREEQTKQEAVELVREVSKQIGSHRGKVSTRIWLIGVALGLVAAGTGAYVLVRRRLTASLEEPLVDLPVAGTNGHAPTSQATPAPTPVASVASTTTTPAPVTTTPAAATAAPAPSGTANGQHAAAEGAGEQQAPPEYPAGELPGGAATVTADGAPAGVVEPTEARFIGNIRTMVYHDADDTDLPAEENRIYFASEEEARDAGYHRHRDEILPGETENEARAGEPSGGA